MENWYTFEERIRGYSELDRWNTHSAYWFAKYGHRGQFRQGGDECRYFEHVREVALILIDEADLNIPVLVQSALLHDTLEDSGVLGNPARLPRDDWERETKYRLTLNFGPEVAAIVRSLTHVGDRESYYKQLAQASIETLVVKMADSIHNLRTMGDLPKAKVLRKSTEYRNEYWPIFDKLRGTPYSPAFWYLSAEMQIQVRKLMEAE